MKFIRVIKSNQILYRGSDKRYGFGHEDWIYLTPSYDYAKWYADKTQQPQIQKFELLTNNIAEFNEAASILADEWNEEYTEKDFLWYIPEAADLLSQFFDGLRFEDPYEKGNIIYLVFSPNVIKEIK